MKFMLVIAVTLLISSISYADPGHELLLERPELMGVCVYICERSDVSGNQRCRWRYDSEASKPEPVHQESNALQIVSDLLGRAETYFQNTGEQLNFLTKWTYDGVCSEERNEA